jgi:hypothetical protein
MVFTEEEDAVDDGASSLFVVGRDTHSESDLRDGGPVACMCECAVLMSIESCYVCTRTNVYGMDLSANQ